MATVRKLKDVTREELIEQLHDELSHVLGVDVEVEQPIAHLISHMLSGVQAQIAIKLFGDDLARCFSFIERTRIEICD